MTDAVTSVNQQIEEAFHFRGNVTVAVRGGDPIEGFLFNRDFQPHASLGKEGPFVELYLVDGSRKELLVSEVEGVELTGEDPAA